MQMIASHFPYEFKPFSFLILHLPYHLGQVNIFQTVARILLMDCEISLVGHYQHFENNIE